MNNQNARTIKYIICFFFFMLSVFVILLSTITNNNSEKNNSPIKFYSVLFFNTDIVDSDTNIENNIVLLNNESRERQTTKQNNIFNYTSNYSSMTRSEIIEYKKTLEEQFLQYETNTENRLTYKEYIEELKGCEEALNFGNYLYPYTQDDLNIMAYAIHREAGSYWLSDRHRDLVGCVILNRKNQNGINRDLMNPSFSDIINESGQYPYKSWNVDTSIIEDYCWESAIRVLEHKVECPDNIVYQASFKQGSGVYDKFYDKILGTTTYFCTR